MRRGAINPVRLLKLVLFLFEWAKSIAHTHTHTHIRTLLNPSAFKNYCQLKTENYSFWVFCLFIFIRLKRLLYLEWVASKASTLLYCYKLSSEAFDVTVMNKHEECVCVGASRGPCWYAEIALILREVSNFPQVPASGPAAVRRPQECSEIKGLQLAH